MEIACTIRFRDYAAVKIMNNTVFLFLFLALGLPATQLEPALHPSVLLSDLLNYRFAMRYLLTDA